MIAALIFSAAPIAFANPIDGVVVSGNANISANGNTLTITQQSNRAVIDWRGFDVQKNETTNFAQPNANAMTLNRVNDTKASVIDGSVTANGKIFIVNQNGVLFGKNAKVDVNGVVATSADIANERFMADTKLNFDRPGKPDAKIENRGTITAKDAGLVGLVAPHVVNSGVITARLGKVQLSSGSRATVDLYGDKLMEVAVDDNVTSQLVDNSGRIVADGGSIALTAAAGRQVVNSLITVSGELRAQSVGMKNGKIVISAEGSNVVANNATGEKGKKSGNSTVVITGKIDVSNKTAGTGEAGKVEITADRIQLASTAAIDATAAAKGGTVHVGGQYLGQGETPAALMTIMEQGATINASALESGKGGEVIMYADNRTEFGGSITANGAGANGEGGFVETSGRVALLINSGRVYATGRRKQGQWLLDPADLEIVSGADANTGSSGTNPITWVPTAGNNTSKISVTTITNALNAGTDVIVQTGADSLPGNGNIRVTAAISSTLGTLTGGATKSGSLTLSAYGNIMVYAGISLYNGALTLRANNAGAADGSTGAGAIYIDAAAPIATHGGNITLGGGSGPITAGSGFAVGNAALVKGIDVGGSLQAGGGHIIMNGIGYGGGSVPIPGIAIKENISTTGTGSIAIHGQARGTIDQSHGVIIGTNSRTVTLTTEQGGLTLVGSSTVTAAGSYGIFLDGDNYQVTLQTGSGTLLLDGTGSANAASGHAIRLKTNSRLLSTSGDIVLKAYTSSGEPINASGTHTVNAGSGKITVFSNNWAVGMSGVSFTTSGLITIAPYTDISFGVGASSGYGMNFTTTQMGYLNGGSYQFGTLLTASGATRTQDVSLRTNLAAASTVAGKDVTVVSGQDITVDAAFTRASGDTGKLTLSAVRNITVSSGAPITLRGGDLLLRANSQGSADGSSGSGAIAINASIATSGGNITLGGGNGSITGVVLNADGTVNSAATGYAVGNATLVEGIRIAADVNAGSGTVLMNGKGGANGASNNHGISIGAGVTTSGAIQISGIGGGIVNSGSNHGVVLDGASAILRSTGSGLMSVMGQGGLVAGLGTQNYGIRVANSASVSAAGSGAIRMRGLGGGAGGSGGTQHGINLGSTLSGNGGAIVLAGVGGASSGSVNVGVYLSGATVSNAGEIRLYGEGAGTGVSSNSAGVQLAASQLYTTAGDIILQGTGATAGTGASNSGIAVGASTIDQRGNGLLRLEGRGGNSGASGGEAYSFGVNLNTDGIVRASGNGARIEVVGYGGLNPGNSNYGIRVYGATVEHTGTGGSVTLEGTSGGDGNGSNNMGIVLDAGGRITSNSVNIAVTGTALATGGTGRAANGVLITGTVSPGGVSNTITSGGDLSVTGIGGLLTGAQTGTSNGISIGTSNAIVTTGSGSITLKGVKGGYTGSVGIWFASGGYNGVVTAGASGARNVTLYTDTINTGTSARIIDAAGLLTIAPYSDVSFGVGATTGYSFNLTDTLIGQMRAGSYQFGTVLTATGGARTQDVSLRTGIDFGAKDVTVVSGRDLNIDAAFTRGGGGTGKLTLEAVRNINVNSAGAITLRGGDLLLRSNSQGSSDGSSGSGAIAINASIATNGGNITLGGGNGSITGVVLNAKGERVTPASGYAVGSDAAHAHGISITAEMNAGGGAIILNGKGYGVDGQAAVSGIWVGSSGVVQSTGPLTISGLGGLATTYAYGLQVNGTIQTTGTGLLTVYSLGGNASGTTNGGRGMIVGGTGKLLSTGTGASAGSMRVGAVGGTNGGGLYVETGGIISTADGAMVIHGTASTNNAASFGIQYYRSGNILSTGNGSITLYAQNTANNAYGFRIGNYAGYVDVLGGPNAKGAITVYTDTWNLTGTNNGTAVGQATVQTTGKLTIASYSDVAVSIGGAASGTKLYFSDVALAQMNAGSYEFGSANTVAGTAKTNDFTINTGADFGDKNVTFISGGNMVLGTPGLTKASGTGTVEYRFYANGNISLHAPIQASSGRINLLVNADRDATGGGYISVSATSGITTNGGNITLGGGAGLITAAQYDANGKLISGPTGFAQSPGVASGITINGVVNAGGGNIVMNGQGLASSTCNNNCWGLAITGTGVEVKTSGNGTIDLAGVGGGDSSTNFVAGVHVYGKALVSTATGALRIYAVRGSPGSASGTNSAFSLGSATVRTTAGDLWITNPTGSFSWYNNASQIAAVEAGGNLRIIADGLGDITSNAGVANILITVGATATIAPYSATSMGIGTGAGTLQVSTDFLGRVTANSYVFGAQTNAANNAATGDLTINTVNDFADKNVTFIAGNDIVIAGNMVKQTGTGTATYTFQANRDITNSGNAGVQATSGKLNLVFNADRDGIDGGVISFSGGTFSSNGGAITLGGGTNIATGYATGRSGAINGIKLSGATLNSGAGTLLLRGQGYDLTAGADGILVESSSQLLATGAIQLTGIGGALNANGIQISNSTVAVTGNGSIHMTGTGKSSGTSNGAGIFTTGSSITAVDGDITLNGTAGNGSGNLNNGVHYAPAGGTIRTTGQGNIYLTGATGNAATFGINLRGANAVRTMGTGNITLTTDSLALGAAGAVNGLNSVTVAPKSASSMGVGTNAPGTLLLNDTVVSYITAGNYIFGSTNTTNLTINTAADFGNKNVTFIAGSDIILAGNLVKQSGTGTATYTFKANNDVISSGTAGVSAQAGRLNLIFWGNADNDQVTGGRITLAGGSFITKGGDILLGGGLDDGNNGGVAGDGRPDNAVYYVSTSNGIALAGTTLDARDAGAGGHIVLRGKGGARGVVFMGGSQVRTDGNGRIALYGEAIGGGLVTNAYGINLQGGSGANLLQTQHGDIILHGTATGGTLNTIGVVFEGNGPINNVQATGTGSILLTGDGTGADLYVTSTSITTATGDIRFTVNAIRGMNVAGASVGAGRTLYIAPRTASNMTLGTGAGLNLANDQLARLTAGDFVFGSTDTTQNLTINTTADFGDKNVTFISGNDISIAGNLVKQSGTGTATYTFQANRDIANASGAGVQATSGKLTLVFHADRDGVDGGAINFSGVASSIRSNGGSITFGGGAGSIAGVVIGDNGQVTTPAVGFATGTATNPTGVRLAGTVDAGGGDIIINGRGNDAAASNSYGVQINGAVQTSGTGVIRISGTSGTAATNNAAGVYVNGTLGVATGALHLQGITVAGGGTASYLHGINVAGLVQATGTGKLLLNGLGSTNATSSSYGINFENNSVGLQGGGGLVVLRGVGGANSGDSNLGIRNQSLISNAGNGDLYLYGSSLATGTGTSNRGLQLGGVTSVVNGTLYLHGEASMAGSGNITGIYANSGTIQATGTGHLVVRGIGANGGFGYTSYSADTLVTNSGNITIYADRIELGATGYNIRAGGKLIFAPYTNIAMGLGTSIPGALNVTTAHLGKTSAGSYQFGDWTTGDGTVWTQSLTVMTGHDFGDTSATFIGGQDINLAGHLSKLTGTGTATYLFQANRDIYNSLISGSNYAGVQAASGKANLLFQADTDQATNPGGRIFFGGGTFSSNGGNITLGGGANLTTGYAQGRTNAIVGIALANTTLDAGAGDLVLRGRGASILNDGMNGVQLSGTTLLTSSGAISVTGIGGGNAGNSIANMGVVITGAASVKTTGAGLLTIHGTGGTGGAASANSNQYGVMIGNANGIVATGSGGIAVTGIGGAGVGHNNIGVVLQTGGSIVGNGGQMDVVGQGGASDSNTNFGVIVTGTDSVIRNVGSGVLNVTGTGGGTGNGRQNNGVLVTSQGRLVTVNGALNVIGTGGGAGSGDLNHGVVVSSAGSSISAGNGNISVTGIGGNLAGTGGSNNGINANIADAIQTTGTGSITLRGVQGGQSSSRGISVTVANGVITNGTSGARNITLYSDTFSLSASGVAIDADGILTVAPYSNISMGVGPASGHGLNLSDDMLGKMSGGSYVFGALVNGNGTTSTQDVIVNTARDFADKSLTFVSGQDINIAGDLLKQSGASAGTATYWFQAKRDIYNSNSAGVSVNSGVGKLNIILQADTDQATNLGGSIRLTSGNFRSRGGDIIFSGGADYTTGYAYGWSGRIVGVNLSGATVNANGGTITVRGHGYDGNTNDNIGVYMTSGASLQSQNQVHVTGVGGSGGTDDGAGVYLINTNTRLVASGAGTITVNGTAQGGSINGSGSAAGVRLGTGASIASDTGAITLTGQGSADTTYWGIGVMLGGGSVSSNSGKITLNGTGTGGGTDYGVRIDNNSITTVSGDIELNGTSSGNHGLRITQGSQITSTSGHIAVTGRAGSGGYGIQADSTSGTNNRLATGGAVTLVTDSIILTNTDIVAGGVLSVKPYSNIGMSIGTNVAGTLNVSNAVLAQLNGGSYVFGTMTTATGGANTGDITIATIADFGNKNVTFISGQDINIVGNLIKQSGTGTATYTFQANRNIYNTDDGNIFNHNGPGVRATAGQLNLIFNADRDANGSGAIRFTDADFTTRGGSFVMGGGANPESEYATGSEHGVFDVGIDLQQGSIDTGGGAISLFGKGEATGSHNRGVSLGAMVLTTGNGNITINGIGGGEAGFQENRGAVLLGVNITTTGGDVTIHGTRGAGNANNSSVMIATGNIATEEGDIYLKGVSVTVSAATFGNAGMQGDMYLEADGSVCCSATTTTSGTFYWRSYTNGSPINIGSNPIGGIASAYVFGSATTGDITLNTNKDFGDANITVISGRDINIAGNLIKQSGTGTATYNLQANGNIYNSLISGSAYAGVQASSGKLNLIFNADRDQATNPGGYVNFTNASITSNGGDITIGGGLDPATGYAYATAGASSGVTISGGTMDLNGGHLRIHGNGHVRAAKGVSITNNALVKTSGTGRIDINGQGGINSSGNYLYGVFIANGSAVEAQNGALNITGVSGTGTASQYGVSVESAAGIRSAGNGKITIIGTSKGNVASILFTSGGAYVEGATGDIELIAINTGGYKSSVNLSNASSETLGEGTNVAGTYSGNIIIQADNFINVGKTLQTTGSITVKPYTAGYTLGVGPSAGYDVVFASTHFARLQGSTLIFGAAETGDVTVSTGYDFGDKNLTFVSGNDIIIAGNLIKQTGTGTAEWLFKANRDIYNSNGADLGRTSGAMNVTLWADADELDGGNITLNGGSVTTGGGHIVMGGGLDIVTGYAQGRNGADTVDNGISLTNGSTLNAGGGNITLRGKGFSGAGTGRYGIYSSSQIGTSGTGAVGMHGEGGALASSDNAGIYLAHDVLAGSGGITLTGIGGGTTGNINYGLRLQGSQIKAGNGAIQLTGTGAAGSSDIFLQTPSLESGGGAVRLSGTVLLAADLSVTSGNGAITFDQHLVRDGVARSVSLNAGTGTVTAAAMGTSAMPLKDLTITADDVVLGGDLYGSGMLTVRQSSTGRKMNIGGSYATTHADYLTLDTAEIGRLKDGWQLISLGAPNASGGVINIGSSTWNDPVSFRSEGGAIVMNITGALEGKGNASFDFITAEMQSGTSIVTEGGHVQFAGNFTATNANVNTGGGNFTVAYRTIPVNFTLRTGGGNATFCTQCGGSGNAILGGNAGTLADLDLGTGTLTFSGIVNSAGNLTANAGTIVSTGNWGDVTPLGTVSLTSIDSMLLPTIKAAHISVTTTGAAADITLGAGKTLTASATSGTGISLNAGRNIRIDSTSPVVMSGGALSFTAGDRTQLMNNATYATNGGAISFTGGVMLASSSTLNSGGGNITLNDALVVDSTGARNLTVNAGTGTFTAGAMGTNALKLQDLTVTAGDVVLGGNLYGSGNLLIQPGTDSRVMRVAVSGSGLVLDADEVSRIQNGWQQIEFGRPAGTTLYLGTSDWYDSVTFRSGTGITLLSNASITSYDGASISFTGPVYTQAAATINAAGSLAFSNFFRPTASNDTATVSLTAANDVTFSNAVQLNGAHLNVAAGGTVAFNNSVVRYSGSAARNITVSAGNITFNGSWAAMDALGAVSLTSTNSIALPSINASSILVRTTGAASDITLALGTALTASGTGNALVLSAGRNFINHSGSATPFDLTGTGARWLVYSAGPVNNVRGGLMPDASEFGKTYATNGPATIGVGNRFVYATSTRPVLTYTTRGLVIRYGDAIAAADLDFDYVSGLIAGDTLANIGLTGAAGLSTTYVQGTTGYSATAYANMINGATGTLSSPLGYSFAFNAGDLTVNKRILTIGLIGTITKTYDGDRTADLLAGNYSYGNRYGLDNVTVTGTGLYDTKNAGTGKTVTVSGLTLGGTKAANYELAATTASTNTASIGKKTLLVTAGNRTITYGNALPATSISYNGFVDGEGAGDLGTAPTVTSQATANSNGYVNAGTYTGNFQLSGGSDQNYSFSYTHGNLTVAKRQLNVTANSGGMTIVYGGTAPAVGITYGPDFAVGEGVGDLTVAPTITTPGGKPNAGTYTNYYTVGGGVAANYSFNYTHGALLVSKRGLNVVANNRTITYGQSVPAGSFSITGFVNGDDATDINVLPTLTSLVNGRPDAGTYNGNYVVSGGSDQNYSFNYLNGNLTVAKKDLNVTIDNLSMIYGNAIGTPGLSFDGFVNGDDATDLDHALTVVSQQSGLVDVGTYINNFSIAAGTDRNYTINAVRGDLVVVPRALTVSTHSIGKFLDQADPAFTGSNNLVAADAGQISWSYSASGYTGGTGSYVIVATANDPNGRLANYIRSNNYGIFTVLYPGAAAEVPELPSTVDVISQTPIPVVTMPTFGFDDYKREKIYVIKRGDGWYIEYEDEESYEATEEDVPLYMIRQATEAGPDMRI